MAGKSGRNGNAQKNYYNSYASKAEKNRKARLERHRKNHPNDQQGGSTKYRRKTPVEPSGWLTADVNDRLYPTQTSTVTVKTAYGKKEEVVPEVAKHLKEMTKAEAKRFAKMYARVRKLHKHAALFGKKKKPKA